MHLVANKQLFQVAGITPNESRSYLAFSQKLTTIKENPLLSGVLASVLLELHTPMFVFCYLMPSFLL